MRSLCVLRGCVGVCVCVCTCVQQLNVHRICKATANGRKCTVTSQSKDPMIVSAATLNLTQWQQDISQNRIPLIKDLFADPYDSQCAFVNQMIWAKYDESVKHCEENRNAQIAEGLPINPRNMVQTITLSNASVAEIMVRTHCLPHECSVSACIR